MKRAKTIPDVFAEPADEFTALELEFFARGEEEERAYVDALTSQA